jgi:ADP-ribose pyrophosphatase
MSEATRLSERLVYEGTTFDVAVERVRLPHGVESDLEIVRHDGSVVLIPETDDGTLLLVRQYRHAVGAHLWELPAGSLEAGEDPDAAARRECQEELGLVAERLERGPTYYSTPGFCTERMIFYRVTGLRRPGAGDPQASPDDDEDIEVRAFTRSELRALVDSGQIEDLKTLAGLALGDALGAQPRG